MAIILKILPDKIRKPLNRWRFEKFQMGRELKGSSIAAFDYYKCIFVHLPKTGGISVSHGLWGHLTGVHKSMEDYSRIFSDETFNTYYKFTFVRNPWDRLVSAYTFLKAGGLHAKDAKWAEKHLSGLDTFEDFVLNWLNSENIQKGIHLIPQSDFLKIDGQMRMDFIGRFENLQADFDIVKHRIGLPDADLPHKNKSARKDYKSYYTNDSVIEKVAEVYAEDIELLQYSFD